LNISVILSGGTSSRFGSNTPKQYHIVHGKEVIGYVVEAIEKCPLNNKTIIVAATADMPRLTMTYGVECTEAGLSHNRSVKNGLDYIKSNYPHCKKVLFVDSCRPFISNETVLDFYELLDKYDAAFMAKHITDSLGCENDMFVERSPYFLIQKPEAFAFDLIYNCFSAESPATAIVQQLPNGAKIMKHFSTEHNLKITYPNDLTLAHNMMKQLSKED